MRTSVRRGLSALAIAGGFTLLGIATAGSATADDSTLCDNRSCPPTIMLAK